MCCRRLFRYCCYVVCLLPCSVRGRNSTKDFFESNLAKSARGVAWIMFDDPFVIPLTGVTVVVLILFLRKMCKWLFPSSKGFWQCTPDSLWKKLASLFRRWYYGKKNQNGNGDPETGLGTTFYAEQQQDQIRRLELENETLQNKLELEKSAHYKLNNDLQLRTRECSDLRNKVNRQNEEISNFKLRLSKMASEKMRDDNPTVEDLNDPWRPTALASRWTSLFRCGEYWTAYETVKQEKGEDDATSLLHKICQATYETTKKFVEDLTQGLIDEVSHRRSPELNSADQRRRETLEFILDKDEKESILGCLQDALSQTVKDGNSEGKGQEDRGQEGKAILRLLRSRVPPTSLREAVTRAVGKLEVSPELIRSFVDQLTELIYYMRVQDIKVVVDFECKAGRRLDQALYEVESGKAVDNPRSAVVKAVMRPALLRHEQGPVLCKGEVELESSPTAQNACTQTDADLTTDEENAKLSSEGNTTSTNENKVTSQSTDAGVVRAEQVQQSSLAMTEKANPPLQKGPGDSKPSTASPHGGGRGDPAKVEPAATAGRDQATALAATTMNATSPDTLADQSATTVVNMD